LMARGRKVVFAESCTGGLVSGALTATPGISSYHCGGMVVYRNETKIAYLRIPRKLLAAVGPVSEEGAALMARRGVELNPEAEIAASVTGHRGPDAPPELDGLVFSGVAVRAAKKGAKPVVIVHEMHCQKAHPRIVRQRWVVERVLDLLG